MQQEAFRDQLKKEPFQPFTLKLSNGDVLDVIHPDFAMISPHGDHVIVFSADNHSKTVDMGHVVTLTPKRERRRTKSVKN